MTVIQVLSSIGSVLFLSMILIAVYKEKIQDAYAIIWILIGGFILMISLSEKLLKIFSVLVGIQTPGFAVILFLLFGVLLLLFQLTVVISSLNERLRRLAEEIALLQEKIKRKEK